ncbi:MAG: sigma-70 family RNA polymerase sigma factor, partial [Clostridia bacterium]|nr:sigma-70 family RNA polymerase sigma factor [Clostridia bacterium]
MITQTVLLLLSGVLAVFLQVSGTHSFPQPLSAEEERRLFREMRGGSADARETLICHNLRLVSHIVRKYYPAASNADDLLSIGTVGLIKAVDTFDPDKGAQFATYASRCLQNEILMHFRSQKKRSAEVSMQETIDTDRDGNPLTYVDIIAEDDTIADDLDIKVRSARVRMLVQTVLDAREREIIVLRYGLGGAAPL